MLRIDARNYFTWICIAVALSLLPGAAALARFSGDWTGSNSQRSIVINAADLPPSVFPNFFAHDCNISAFEVRTSGRNLELVIKSLGDKVTVRRNGPVMTLRAENQECPRRYKITVEIDDEMHKEP